MAVQTPVSEERVAQMFNRIAGRYDFLNRLLSMRQDQRWRKILLRHVPFAPEGTFLDVATGTGDVVLAALREHREYAHFHGVDISKNMLQHASLKANTNKDANRVTFQAMSAESLDFASDSVDCLSISFGLRNVVDRDQGIREFSRVLKPDGTLLILEFFQPRSSLFNRLFQFYFHNILPTIGGLLSDREAYRYLPQSVAGFYSFSELLETLRAHKLDMHHHQDFLWGSCRLVVARKLS